MLPDGFHDRRHRFSYLIAVEHARRIRLDPSLLEAARDHMERRLPYHRAGEDMWRKLLDAGVEAVVAALLDQSPAGDYARETAPAFGGIPASIRRALLAQAAEPVTRGSGMERADGAQVF